MNKLPLLALILLPAYLQAQTVISVPADTSLVRLARITDISNGNTIVRAERGTYLVSEADLHRYRRYESTLLNARDQLVASQLRVGTLVSTLQDMEEKLKAMEAVNGVEIVEDLETLNSLQIDLREAKEALNNSNEELSHIKEELERAQKKLRKRSKQEQMIRVSIGVAGLITGLLIGGAR